MKTTLMMLCCSFYCIPLTLQLSTRPYFSNISSIARSSVCKFNPNTPRHLLTGGASRSPSCRLRFDIGDVLRDTRRERLRERDRERDREYERPCFRCGVRERLRLLLLLREGDRTIVGPQCFSVFFFQSSCCVNINFIRNFQLNGNQSKKNSSGASSDSIFSL